LILVFGYCGGMGGGERGQRRRRKNGVILKWRRWLMCFCAIGFDTRSSDRPVGTAGEAHVVRLSGRLRQSGYNYEVEV